MDWHSAVKTAIRRLVQKTGRRTFSRQLLIAEEMSYINELSGTRGRTPTQTLSRVLQELREQNFLYFLDRGEYLLVDSPVSVEEEDLSASDIDGLIENNRLAIGAGSTDTADSETLSKRRIGQQRLRILALKYYNEQCAFCDITDTGLLVAGHISRWSDNPAARGRLDNVICFCRFHDALFENGYLALADDYTVLKKAHVKSRSIQVNLETAQRFRRPTKHRPNAQYLAEHRRRVGME